MRKASEVSRLNVLPQTNCAVPTCDPLVANKKLLKTILSRLSPSEMSMLMKKYFICTASRLDRILRKRTMFNYS